MSRAADLFDQLIEGGATRVQEMIANGEAEELFLDFKRSADNGSGVRLNNHDRANLAKSISGFGTRKVAWWSGASTAGPIPSEEMFRLAVTPSSTRPASSLGSNRRLAV